jgi:hypothetical protein
MREFIILSHSSSASSSSSSSFSSSSSSSSSALQPSVGFGLLYKVIPLLSISNQLILSHYPILFG